MTDVLLPAVSPTMEKGTLARWFVDVGSTIRRGDIIAEIETDKASIELVSEHDGVISELVVADGTADVAVGAIIARRANGDAAAQPASQRAAAAEASKQPARPLTEAVGAEEPRRDSAVVPAPRRSDDAAVLASPLSRRLARQLGI